MREYEKLVEVIKDWENGVIEDLDFWFMVRDIAEEGIYWTHKINQDDM